ncbi:MAG: M48 family metalloprotease, partial [Candidatus Accumulibacter sp.]|nr:M48 family metalloprotease [Accumulibacter sp.]
MDFFGQQIKSRRRTLWLAFCFTLAVLVTAGLSYFGTRVISFLWNAASLRIDPIALMMVPLFISLFFIARAHSRRKKKNGETEGDFAYNMIVAIGSLALLAAVSGMTWRDTLFYTLPDVKTLLWTLLAVVGGIVFGSLAKAARLAGNGALTVARELGGQRIARPGKDPLERRLLNVLDEMSIAAGVIPPLAFVLPEEAGINALAIGQDTSRSAIVVTRGALERLSRDELQALIAHEIS